MTDVMGFVRSYFSVAEFSWISCIIAVVVILITGFMSVERIGQGWVIIAELILFPAMSGMIVPYFSISVYVYLLLLYGFSMVSWHLQKSWWPKRCISHRSDSQGDDRNWYKDMNAAGWINLIFMTVQMVMLGAYLLSPMPASVVRTVWRLLVVLVPIAVIKPAVMLGWQISKRKVVLTTGTAVGLWLAIAIISWIKLSMK